MVPIRVGKIDKQTGLGEPALLSDVGGEGDVVQFVRYGFVKLRSKVSEELEFIYIHG